MLDFSRFRVLTFDCYGTLIDWETGIFGALRPILTAHGKDISDSALLEMYSNLEADAESGAYITYDEVLRQVVRGFGERLGFASSENEARSLPESLANWPAFPDTRVALQSLKSRYRLAILSNVDDGLFAHSHPRLGVEFDAVITAQQVRAYKPSLKMFEAAERKLGNERAEWLHVGQSLYHDVEPAQSLGIATVWVNRLSPRPGAGAAKRAPVRPDLEVRSMAELAALAVAS